MADYATQYTDKQIDLLEAEIAKVYREAQKDIRDKMQSFYRAFADKARAHKADLASGKITLTEYQNWLRGQVFQSKRWKEKQDSIAKTLTLADRKAAEIINKRTPDVFRENANYTAYDIERGMKGTVSFNLYDSKSVERLMKDKPELLPRRVIDGRKANAWNQKEIANAVAQGIIQGESIPDLAKRIARDTGIKNGNSSMLYARTAMTGAQNAGRMEMLHDAQEKGIVVKKKWLATMDKRTRDVHRDELNGVEVDVDEPFHTSLGDIMFPGDPNADPANTYNCRCTLVYVYDVKASAANLREQEEANENAQPDNLDSGKQDSNDSWGENGSKPPSLDDIWEPSGDYTPAKTQREFMMQNMAELKAAGVRNGLQIHEQYINTMMNEALRDLHEISEQDAVDIAKEGIPESLRNLWFVDADSSAKPKIVECIVGDSEVLNSGWNIAYRNYKETVGNSDVTFEEFLSTPMKMYRGTRGQSEIASDEWISFSLDRKIAESFGNNIEEITIRPIDTWGSYQTTAEAEILVPKRMLNKLRR